MNDVFMQGRAMYTVEDIVSLLQIEESSLRAYCFMLQEYGHRFYRNEKRELCFVYTDIIMLRKLIELERKNEVNLYEAVEQAITWRRTNVFTAGRIGKQEAQVQQAEQQAAAKRLEEELQTFKEQQMNFNKYLLEKIEKQREYIDYKLEERDQNLMLLIRETQETKRLLVDNQTKWWQFWKR